MDKTKYDVKIHEQQYRISNYTRSDLRPFIARFGGGDQKESEFDLLKSRTITSFEAGSLQRYWEEDNTTFAIESLYNYYDDGVLYPDSTALTQQSTGGIGTARVQAWVRSNDYVFIAYITITSPTTKIKRIDKSGTELTLTLPAALSGSAVTDMVIKDGQLWICAGANDQNVWYMPLTSNTVSAVTAGTDLNIGKMAVWRGDLYFTDGENGKNHTLHKYTGDTSTRSATEIGRTGKDDFDSDAELRLYNGRIYLVRRDGLWVYDGIQLTPIEDLEGQEDPDNFKFPHAYQGYLHYFMPDGYYRYNGATIEKLFDIGDIGMPVDVCVGDNRVWMLFANGDFYGSSRYDKAMGYDHDGGNSVHGRVASYDGKGVFTYDRTNTFVKNPATEDFAGQGEARDIVHFNGDVFVFMDADKTGLWHKSTAVNGKTIEIVTSIFDADLAAIDKDLEEVNVSFDGTITNLPVTVYYRTSGFDGSGSWLTLGSIEAINKPVLEVWKELDNGLTFKQVQLKFVASAASTIGIARINLRYVLMPPHKIQWQMQLKCYGDDSAQGLHLKDGTYASDKVRALRGNAYSARDKDNAITYIDVDCLDLNGALDASQTTVTVDSTDLAKGDHGFILIDDELMHYTAKTATTLTVERGVLGTIAVAHNDDEKVHLAYRVYMKEITAERILMQDDVHHTDLSDVSLPSEMNVVLQEI